MNKVQETLPNVVGGVSQQPPALRGPENCEVQINAVASTVEGLVKRPPFEFVPGANFPVSSAAPFVHAFRRADRDIAISIDNGRIFVCDLKSGTMSEAAIDADAAAYFSAPGDPADAFDAVTVQDTTFVVNKTVSAAIITETPTPAKPDAIVFWRGSGYGETFKVRIERTDTSTSAEWSVRIDEPPTTGAPPLDPLKTNIIAGVFAQLLQGGTAGVTGVSVVSAPGSASTLLGVDVELEGSRIRLTAPEGSEMSVYVEDGQGGNFVRSVIGKVDKVSDLPAVGFPDFLIRVAGNLATIVDDYWVKWDGSVWLETVDPTCVDRPNPATMPHIIRPKVGGGWEAKRYSYASRVCGDLVTNPSPSFVDGKIVGLFFHRDRLGLLTQDSIVQSEASEYGNFYRTTVTSAVGSDPIDIMETEPLFATPFDRNLAVFCNTKQVIASTEGPWTASTLALTDVSTFEMDRSVRPHVSGRSIFFASTNGGFSRIKRFMPLADTAGGYDERDLCIHVPRYVPKDLRRISVSEAERMMVCFSRASSSELKVYQWLEDSSGDLAQSAWHTWTTPLPVLDAFFAGSVLYVVVRHGSTARIVACDLTPNRSDAGLDHLVHLDGRFADGQITSIYDATLDRTAVTLPVTPVAGADYRLVWRAGAPIEGRTFHPLSADGNVLTFSGDVRQPFYVGALYPETYQFSQFVLRDGDGLKRPIERVNVGLLDLEVVNTAEMDVKIEKSGRAPRTIEFNSRLLSGPDNLLNQTVLRSATFRVPIRARSDRVKVSLTSTSHLPMRVTGATWRGSYSDKQTTP